MSEKQLSFEEWADQITERLNNVSKFIVKLHERLEIIENKLRESGKKSETKHHEPITQTIYCYCNECRKKIAAYKKLLADNYSKSKESKESEPT